MHTPPCWPTSSCQLHGIYCATTAQTRPGAHVAAWQALFRFSSSCSASVRQRVGSPNSCASFVIMDSLAVLGDWSTSSRSQSAQPRLFDNWGNSHQIMHVMYICSIIYLHWGTLEDLAWIKTYQCPTE
ncbi:progestin and adipoQ receptor family member 4-like protein [Lates japonicus]|uniref:Progestin and adipoQ receptor family member 4-like protein n=1 Tax=Lates japonicus TaxID=270547 RepID=A0AAD3NKT0_LATJO|nr:progestin and adipoQ receptor family member 4-like protein [Lates japonicus]